MIRLIRSYIRDSCGPSSIPWASIFFLSFSLSLSLSLSVCLSVCLSIYLSVCLSVRVPSDALATGAMLSGEDAGRLICF